MKFTFIETPLFTADWRHYGLSDDDLQALQRSLTAEPTAGPVERGTGGVRKVRFAPRGRGKSGAFRACYFPVPERALIVLFVMYGKNDKAGLSAAERAAARVLAARIKRGSDW